MRIVGRVEIDRPASQVWAYVADYGNDANWRAGVTQMRPSTPGTAQVGVTTREALRLLGRTFRTDATIDPVEPGRLLAWRAHDRQKQLQGSRLVEPSGPRTSRFTEVVEGRLLAESFFASLKGECLDQQPWPTRTAARRATVEYIAWYNGTRLHSTLGYMTPTSSRPRATRRSSSRSPDRAISPVRQSGATPVP